MYLNEQSYQNYHQVEMFLKYHWPFLRCFQRDVNRLCEHLFCHDFSQTKWIKTKPRTQLRKQQNNPKHQQSKNKSKLTSNHMIYPLIFIKFAPPSSGAACKNQRKNKLKFTEKERRDRYLIAWFILFSIKVQIFFHNKKSSKISR